MVCNIVFFFKQKTAYEMRISDWSSDVCSSDLHKHELHIPQAAELTKYLEFDILKRGHLRMPTNPVCHKRRPRTPRAAYKNNVCFHALSLRRLATEDARSEEHTSELQSLMRISYAVFCLKNKNHKREKTNH